MPSGPSPACGPLASLAAVLVVAGREISETTDPALPAPHLLNTGYEAGRLLVLAVVVAGISLLGYFRMLTTRGRRTAGLALAATLLAVAWLESFPAGDHSAAIGLYILFGALALILGLAAIEQRPRGLSTHSLLAIWNL